MGRLIRQNRKSVKAIEMIEGVRYSLRSSEFLISIIKMMALRITPAKLSIPVIVPAAAKVGLEYKVLISKFSVSAYSSPDVCIQHVEK